MISSKRVPSYSLVSSDNFINIEFSLFPRVLIYETIYYQFSFSFFSVIITCFPFAVMFYGHANKVFFFILSAHDTVL